MTLRESRTPRLDRPCGGRAKKGPGDPERLLRPGPVFDIQEFGATPDGTALNTAAIQRVTVAEEQRMINNDGIDLDACRDVTVSDSFFRTADDCLILRSSNQVYDVPGVCENVTVSNCVLDSWCQGIRVGCPGDGVIRNCVFSNLVITSSGNGILCEFPRHYLPADGQATADVSSVRFANVVINCTAAPIKVAVEAGIALPRVEGLSFSDFRIRSGGPCVVQGSPETTIRNVTFANIDIATTGDDAIICRHCEGVNLTNVRLTNLPAA